MKKIKQTSLDQTGIAIIERKDKEDLFLPLFSLSPIKEANELALDIPGFIRIKNIFIANNLLDYKIEDAIKDFKQLKRPEVLPQNLMEELVSGFPFITGYENENISFCFG